MAHHLKKLFGTLSRKYRNLSLEQLEFRLGNDEMKVLLLRANGATKNRTNICIYIKELKGNLKQ